MTRVGRARAQAREGRDLPGDVHVPRPGDARLHDLPRAPGGLPRVPGRSRCAYYDLLQFERRQQDDQTVIPLVQITFREVKKETVCDDNTRKKTQVWEWEPEKP